jgi:phage gpG-like protein
LLCDFMHLSGSKHLEPLGTAWNRLIFAGEGVTIRGMISLDDKDVKELADDLKKISERAYPYATRDTINKSAWKAREFAQREIGKKMIERNKWTRGSVRVEQARTLRVSAQEAAVGSTEEYMVTQEFGATERSKRKHGVALPTSYSAGQMGQKPRTRLPRRANRLPNIKLTQRSFKTLGRSKKQRIAVAVKMAVAKKLKYVYIEANHKGIVKILGGGRKTKSGRKSTAKLRSVQDLEYKSVRIRPRPWLGPAVNLASLRVEDRFRQALLFQFRRLGIGR